MTAQPIVALDVATADAALALVDVLGPACDFYKIGNELFTAAGPAIVQAVRDRGGRVFLDLKFHDIPKTVAGGAASAAALGASLLTVHASGGERMIRAAVEHAGECQVFAVTVLTSLSPAELGEAWGRPGLQSLEADVVRLAAVAAESGAAGVVCSGLEVAALRARFGDRLALLVPGLRLPEDAGGDQRRIVTPRQAADAGARYLILGRTVTAAQDPRAAYARVVASLR